MNVQALDNPIWAALSTHHAKLTTRAGEVGRYPADIAPFAGISRVGAGTSDDLARLMNPGESVYLLGEIPSFGAGWTVKTLALLPQMVCEGVVPERDGPDWVEMTTDKQRADMVALTALVFPGFFRARTPEMGRYVGIYNGDLLVAMAGERMRLDGCQEISAVCTHPEHVGRGYAQRLIAVVSNAARARGFMPFLHLYRDNVRAMSVYEHLGFVIRRELPFCLATREAR